MIDKTIIETEVGDMEVWVNNSMAIENELLVHYRIRCGERFLQEIAVIPYQHLINTVKLEMENDSK